MSDTITALRKMKDVPLTSRAASVTERAEKRREKPKGKDKIYERNCIVFSVYARE